MNIAEKVERETIKQQINKIKRYSKNKYDCPFDFSCDFCRSIFPKVKKNIKCPTNIYSEKYFRQQLRKILKHLESRVGNESS